MGIEGIIQRLTRSNRLLFLIVPQYNNTAEGQFGVWAYRGNAAQYFNLVWPVIIAFWLWLSQCSRSLSTQAARLGSNAAVILLPLGLLVAACPIICTARGGAIASGLLVLGVVALLMVLQRGQSFASRLVIPTSLLMAMVLGFCLGWSALKPRLEAMLQGDTSDRSVVYRNAWRMAHDFALFGSGAGTFGPLYQLYRSDADQVWEAYAHNDWLESIITLGVIGTCLISFALIAVISRYFQSGGIRAPVSFYALVMMAIVGCLGQAVIDFPFRVYSVLFLFMTLCCILSVIGKNETAK